MSSSLGGNNISAVFDDVGNLLQLTDKVLKLKFKRDSVTDQQIENGTKFNGIHIFNKSDKPRKGDSPRFWVRGADSVTVVNIGDPSGSSSTVATFNGSLNDNPVGTGFGYWEGLGSD